MLAFLQNRLAKDERVLFAYLHGSFLSDLPSRDLDLAVFFRDGLSAQENLAACLSLQEEMSHSLGIPVDVHALDPENLAFSFDALSGKMLFSRAEERRERFEERTIALFMDYKPMLKQILEDLTQSNR